MYDDEVIAMSHVEKATKALLRMIRESSFFSIFPEVKKMIDAERALRNTRAANTRRWNMDHTG